MTYMPESRRTRRDKQRTRRTERQGLTVIDGGLAPGGGHASDEMAELCEMLTEMGVPDELVGALASSGDPRDVFQELVQAGVLPSQEESLTELLSQWRPLLRPGCSALEAELCGVEFLGVMRDAAQDEDATIEIAVNMLSQAEQRGGAEALAMARVLAVVGPARVRDVAAAAADRLVTGRLKDRPWVAELGVPDVGSGFGYTDEFGAQEAVAVTFSYGRKPHAVVVLIDHDLGGGVKDCWLTDQPDRIRSEYRKAAKRFGLDFREYEPAEIRATLDRALSKEPCPVAPDQIVSVRDYLDLVRLRVALLPKLGAASDPRGAAVRGGAIAPARKMADSRTIHRLKVTLRGAKPPIWRRLEVPSGITLQQLHEHIQAAFDWLGSHLWVFETPAGDYGIPDPDLGHRSAASRRLNDVAVRAGDRLRYTYDFGDNWEHDVLVEDVLIAEPGVAYPRCTGGRRAGPPEDCGGIWGYRELLEILGDPAHAEHEERLDWLGLSSGSEFDPARFDLGEVNRTLAQRAKVLVKR
jgi:hypothetical protein